MRLRGLEPDIREGAELSLEWASYFGIPVDITSTLRTMDQQRRLRMRYEECRIAGQVGQPGPCRYPANRPGDSAHNFGLAWDSSVPAADQELWNDIRRYVGFRVPDHDAIHAELPNWRQYV